MRKQDKAYLESLGSLMQSIATSFGRNCEVVLHSLKDPGRSVVKIFNGHITGRKVGAPLTDLGMEILKKADTLESDVVGPYFSRLDDGRVLRCVTSLIRNPQGELIGMLCINLDLSTSVMEFMGSLLPPNGEPWENPVESFPLTPNELILRTLGLVRAEVSKQSKLSPSEQNKRIVTELYKRGVFDVKGAVDLVAKESGISRYTVYNYIREAKLENGEGVGRSEP